MGAGNGLSIVERENNLLARAKQLFAKPAPKGEQEAPKPRELSPEEKMLQAMRKWAASAPPEFAPFLAQLGEDAHRGSFDHISDPPLSAYWRGREDAYGELLKQFTKWQNGTTSSETP